MNMPLLCAHEKPTRLPYEILSMNWAGWVFGLWYATGRIGWRPCLFLLFGHGLGPGKGDAGAGGLTALADTEPGCGRRGGA